jgi:hypothetical protein
MPATRLRIACCLCRKPMPQAKDVYALDEEWQRRFPDMIGTLACEKCAVHTNLWSCRKPDGAFVNGHRRSASQTGNHDFDSWSHFQGHATHAAMVISHPWSGLQQGAEDYLRSTARRPGVSPRVVQRIQDALDRWDARS